MKILMISNNYYPYTGGVARSVAVTMKALQQQGHEVRLITYNFTEKDPVEMGVYRVYCPLRFMYRGKIMPIAWRARSFINQEMKTFKPDLVHIHHPFLLGIWGLFAAYKYKIPVVFTHHTLYEKYVHYLPFGIMIARYLLPYYLKLFYAYLDGIIAPSSAVQRIIQTMTKVPCFVIPSSVDECFISERVQRKTTSTCLKLMTASRLVPEKNIEQLLYAASLLKIPFQLSVCGDGYWRQHLENVAYHHYGFSKEQVVFIGELTSQDLALQYRAADIFIFASQSETQGLVIGEAMACGTPVVALKGSGVEDALAFGGGVLVEKPEEMADVLQRFYFDNERLKALINEAHQQSRFFHSRECIKKLIAFYSTVVYANDIK